MLMRLGAVLGFYPLVYTEDHDGEVRLRIAHSTPFGKWMVHGLTVLRTGILKEDGTITGCSYMRRWLAWPHNHRRWRDKLPRDGCHILIFNPHTQEHCNNCSRYQENNEHAAQ